MKTKIITAILLILLGIFIGRVLFPKKIKITTETFVYTDVKQLCEEKGGKYEILTFPHKIYTYNANTLIEESVVDSRSEGYCKKDNKTYSYSDIEKDFVISENIKLK